MNTNISLLNKYWTDIYFYLHYTHKEKISHQAVRILQLVEKEKNVGVNEIALYIQVSHNTASEHVKRLIEKEYLIKSRQPLDERKVILSLSDLGKEVLYRYTSLDEEKLAKIFLELNEDDKKVIEQALKILSEQAKKCM
ncbi:MarR family winged helix-turn-helix transcriptional regulator [Bacillus sp. JJ722]|uniref:MarR family winged helix-turn-helix transcriptional regulator n=1 Tax=Bacillus sp. JJ722 TaxID=3122973 RepID=UPI002FFDAD0D